jgi:peptide/nickel transport system permease protein
MAENADLNVGQGTAGGPPAATIDAGAATGEGRATPLIRELRLKEQRSLWNNAWRQFRHHHLALAGMVVFTLLVLATFVGSPLYPKAIDEIDFSVQSATISWNHPFGTDSLGQDILARILWGGRISISVGIVAATVAILLGTGVGAIAGFFGGFTDSLLMRITDMFISLPQVPLLLLISYLFRDKLYTVFDNRFNNGNLGIFVLIVGVIAVLSWMTVARLVRASFLAVREKEFIEAARSIGATRSSLIFKHILPNVLSPIIVAATLGVGAAIITESTLSFLGLGFPSDVPTWGTMLFNAKDYLQLSPHEALIPGVFIFITVLSINYIGDGLRDALDPRKTQ